MTYQSLSPADAGWSVAKAPRGSMSFGPSRTGITCDRDATQAPSQAASAGLNPPGRNSLREFPRKSLSARIAKDTAASLAFLKFAQAPRGDWQAIPVTQR